MRKTKGVDWSSYPQAPERFRELVRNAVEEHVPQDGGIYRMEEENNGRRNTTAHAGENTGHRSAGSFPVRINRRRISRGLLIAAAITAVGGAAIAANGSRILSMMKNYGVSEPEAAALLETEVEQEAQEMTENLYLAGETIEKDWQEPIVQITAAAFGGDRFYFEAKASEEAMAYDLGIKDHALLNGYECISMGFYETDEEGVYLGCVEVADKDCVAEILESKMVEVSIRVTASPVYEGILLYTWKDDKAYEELFGKGAFTDNNGFSYYVVSRKEFLSGYTPFEITARIPLDEESKTVIEQYRAQAEIIGTLPEDIELGEETEAASEGGQQTADAGMESAGGVENTGQNEMTENSAVMQYAGADITDGHVTCEIPGSKANLMIDADIVQRQEKLYTGTVTAKTIPLETMASLYEGSPEGWSWSTDEFGTRQGRYEDSHIWVEEWTKGNPAMLTTQYDNPDVDEEPAQYWTGEEDTTEVQEAFRKSNEILAKLGIDAVAEPMWSSCFDIPGRESFFDIQVSGMLEGLPVATDSQGIHANGIITLWDRQISCVSLGPTLEVLEKEIAEILSMEEILESVAEYVASGDLESYADLGTIIEIELEYYVDFTKKGLIFRPIWNFKVNNMFETENAPIRSSYDYCYIDALTGALIRELGF